MPFLAQTSWKHAKKTNKSWTRLARPLEYSKQLFSLFSLHTLRSLLRPMTQVGVNASDKKCDRGNQNQNWVKTRTPTTEGMWVCPVLDCSEMVTLWPPVRNHKSQWIIHWYSTKIPEQCSSDSCCQRASQGKPAHNAASFLLRNTPPSFIVSSAYSVKQMYSTVTTLLYSTQTQSGNTALLPRSFCQDTG